MIKNHTSYILALICFCCLILPDLSFAANEESSTSKESYIFNITRQDAEKAIGDSLSKSLSEEGDYSGVSVKAIMNYRKHTPLYSSNKPINVEIRGLRYDQNNKSWQANMFIVSDKDVDSAMPIAGRYMIMSKMPVLKKSVRGGQLINKYDIEFKSFPQKRINSNSITDIADIIGKTPIRSISAGRPIRKNEISRPALISKNSLVNIRYKTANMEIIATGEALTEGAKNDTIEVRNSSSKKTMRAVVVSSNLVDVIAPLAVSRSIKTSANINY
ncbi:MAG: flagellar basal body P-ring formation chaperone FlgA [Rickettsiales bacterium]